MTSINPEAPDTLREAFHRASIMDEYRALMGTVVEKVRSAKSGLNEAFTSLLIGFEICDVISVIAFACVRIHMCIDSSP